MDEPSIDTVDREHQAAASWVDAINRPGRSRHHIEQAWCEYVGRLNLQYCGVAAHLGTDSTSNLGMSAVASDQITGRNFPDFIGVEISCDRQHAVLTLLELQHCCPGQNVQFGQCHRMREQHRLKVDLIDPMRWFGRWPPSVGTTFRDIAVGATGNWDAPEFYPDGCSAEG